MKMIYLAAVAVLLAFSPASASGGLEGFLSNLNIQAKADMNGFTARLSTQFGVPGAQVSAVISTVKEPADAFMVYQLGQMTRQAPDAVVRTYQKNRGKGWGVIAKEMGIKPGSREFHALKRGDFSLTGNPEGGGSDGPGKGKGRGKGHNK
ncbi:hypothetical protein [Oryzomonas rubra]|uniref:DUF1318 domain-containing protein n=1 Tax=Oryzomonas rubra TaxID=2509454 RepID=A0A5A9XFC3_9BACT|nr:hypothetical protein [Oryzomonas rubra]KAA0891580.1 hypothetical protein ET418_09000 [Oryzomonas rubra]